MIRPMPILVALMLVACGTTSSPDGNFRQPSDLIVFAAASLQPPFDKVGTALKSSDNVTTTFNYAGTQTLTTLLTQGAHADVFASADSAHMKTAQDAGLLAAPPQVFAHNRLEIAVAKGNPKGIHSLADLAKPGLVVVLADPSVPAGKYAQQALSKAGVSLKPKSLELQVTAVLSKVALGEADAGIVYVSDIVTSGQVDGIAIPDSQNVVADYLIAPLNTNAGAKAFITFVTSARGQAILFAAGFDKE